jgi:hypothetical protein
VQARVEAPGDGGAAGRRRVIGGAAAAAAASHVVAAHEIANGENQDITFQEGLKPAFLSHLLWAAFYVLVLVRLLE